MNNIDHQTQFSNPDSHAFIRITRVILTWRYTIICFYALVGLLAFPILEMSVYGKDAPQYTHDVFDDGAFTRLGAISSDWHQFGLTLWNPYLTTGNSSLSQFAMTPFALDVLLSLIVGPFLAYALTYFVLIFVSGYSMHIFLRDSIGLKNIPCLIGGIIYAFSFWHYIGLAVPMFPLLLWLFDKATYSCKSRKWLPLCVLLAAFFLYNSHSQLTLILAALQFAYVSMCNESQIKTTRRLIDLVCVWTLSILLYGSVLATQLIFLPESQRTIWNDAVWGSGLLFTIKTLIAQYSSVVIGMPVHQYLGISPGTYGTYYTGIFGLFFLAVAVLAKHKPKKWMFFIALLVAIPTFDFFASLLLEQAQSYIGFLKSFQFVRVRHFIPFVLTINISIGIHCLLNGELRKINDGFIQKVILVFTSFLIILQYIVSLYAFINIVNQPINYSANIPSLWISSIIVIWGMLLFIELLGIGLYLRFVLANVINWSLTKRFSKALIYVTILMFLADKVEFSRVERILDPSSLGTFQSVLGETPALGFLKKQPNDQAYRSITMNNPDRSRIDHPNRMMFYQLYAADGYENVYPLRYHELFGLLTAPYLDKDPENYKYFHAWGSRAYVFGPDINTALASLIGIRWIHTRNIMLDQPQFTEVFSAGAERVYEIPRCFLGHFLFIKFAAFRHEKLC